MLLEDIKKILNCRVLCCEELLNLEIGEVCATDLMSNVLATSVPILY